MSGTAERRPEALGRLRLRTARSLRRLLFVALTSIVVLGCATIAGLNAAGEALQDAGYEVHELLMERDGLVSADLERSDGAAEDDDFQEAAAIIWEHLQDEAEQAEIRLRNLDDADRTETISAA